MLDTSPKNLRGEVEESIRTRQRMATDPARRMLRLYRGDVDSDEKMGGDALYSYDNLLYEYTSTMRPRLSFGTPKVKIDFGGSTTPQSLAMQAAMNCRLNAMKFGRTTRRLATDAFFSFGASETTMERVPGIDPGKPALWPVIRRISPCHVAVDWACQHWSEARLFVKMWVQDKNDLLKAVYPPNHPMAGQPMYVRKAVEACTADAGLDDARRDLIADAMPWNTITRNQVIGWDVYVPETRMIYCIPFCPLDDSVGGFLREPRRYTGDPSGPIKIYGLVEDADQPYPLAINKTILPLMEETNRHSGKMARDAEKARTIHLIDAAHKAAISAIENAVDGETVPVQGLTSDMVITLTTGKLDPTTLAYKQVLADRFQKTTGSSEASRGDPGQSTATADTIAQESFDTRKADYQMMFRETVTDALKGFAYILWHDSAVRFPMMHEGQQMEFVGGVEDEAEKTLWNQLDMNIEPYSMEAVNQAVLQRRESEKLAIIAPVIPPPIEAPSTWEALLNDYGQAFNQEGLGTKIVGKLMEDQQRAMMMQMQAAAFAGAVGAGGGGPVKAQQTPQRALPPGNPAMAGQLSGQAVSVA